MLNHLSIYNARAEHVSDFHDIFSFIEEIVKASNCDAKSFKMLQYFLGETTD